MRLLGPWLDLERARPEFAVKLSEKSFNDVRIGPLRLSVRVDRVDVTARRRSPNRLQNRCGFAERLAYGETGCPAASALCSAVGAGGERGCVWVGASRQGDGAEGIRRRGRHPGKGRADEDADGDADGGMEARAGKTGECVPCRRCASGAEELSDDVQALRSTRALPPGCFGSGVE